MATPAGKAAAARQLATGYALRAPPSASCRALKELHHFLGHEDLAYIWLAANAQRRYALPASLGVRGRVEVRPAGFVKSCRDGIARLDQSARWNEARPRSLEVLASASVHAMMKTADDSPR